MYLDTLTSSTLEFLEINRGIVLACDHNRVLITSFSVTPDLSLSRVVRGLEIHGNYTATQASFVSLEGIDGFGYLLSQSGASLNVTRVTLNDKREYTMTVPEMGSIKHGMGLKTLTGEYLVVGTSSGMILRTDTTNQRYDAIYGRGTLACGTVDEGKGFYSK
jgi:hypothetical protein